MARSIPIPLKINCGYARTAIRELTTTSKAKHRGTEQTEQKIFVNCLTGQHMLICLNRTRQSRHYSIKIVILFAILFLRNGVLQLNEWNTLVFFPLKIGKLYQTLKRMSTHYQNVKHVSQSMSICKKLFQANRCTLHPHQLSHYQTNQLRKVLNTKWEEYNCPTQNNAWSEPHQKRAKITTKKEKS